MPEKPTVRSHFKLFRLRNGVLLLLCILIIGVIWEWRRRAETDPITEQVTRLVGQLDKFGGNSKEPALSARNELFQLRTNAYPPLARLLVERDTRLDRAYDAFRQKLPSKVRALLPARQRKEPLRQRATYIIRQLGPEACRAMVGAIDKTLSTDVGPFEQQELLRALSWSVPKSEMAVKTLERYLAAPTEDKLLFGWTRAEEIWPAVPQCAPLLVGWLKYGAVAGEAAEGLGLMGRAAASAVPALIEVCDQGVAGNPPNLEYNERFTVGIPFPWNRGMAARALGRIGADSPEALQALQRAWTSTNAYVRASAAAAIGDLGPKALPLLSELLDRLDRTNRLVLEFQLEALGKMGPGARDALPVLRYWADPRKLEAIPAPAHLGRYIGREGPRPLPVTAAFALLRIDPREARRHVRVLADGLRAAFPRSSFPMSRYSELRPLKELLIPLLEAEISELSRKEKVRTAFQILALEPDHTLARRLLLDELDNSDESIRFRAAYYFWRATQDTERVLPLLVESLEDSTPNQLTMNYAAELGSAARPLLPYLEPLIQYPDPVINDVAGRAVSRIAPEKMPPIYERIPRFF